MALDRSRIEYLIEDLRTRPERVRLLTRIGIVAGCVLVLLVVFVLSRGKPPPKPKASPAAEGSPLTPGVADAFAYAKTAQRILDGDRRFSRVYFVPSAATPAQRHGKIVVMGEMASEADLRLLQTQLAKFGISVPMDWQVSVPGMIVPAER